MSADDQNDAIDPNFVISAHTDKAKRRRCDGARPRSQWGASRMNTTVIPDGFERHFRQSPLTDPREPLYSKRTDNAVIVGLRLANCIPMPTG